MGGSDGRADRVRVELNGNPVQSGGLNRERLYRAGAFPDRSGSVFQVPQSEALQCTSFSVFMF